MPLCTMRWSQRYLQQQLRWWKCRGNGYSDSGADTIQLLDLPAPYRQKSSSVLLDPYPAGPRAIHTEWQVRGLCQQSGVQTEDQSSLGWAKEKDRFCFPPSNQDYISAYFMGRLDRALVTAHTWSARSCHLSKKMTEVFQSCRNTNAYSNGDSSILIDVQLYTNYNHT